MTRRFYIDPPALSDDQIEIHAALAHRLAKVLRLRTDEEIVLFDGSGTDVLVRLEEISERSARASVIERRPGPAEPHAKVSLYQSITKGERFEWLLEKATELGVSRFVPLITARAVVRTAGEGNKMDRWRRIAVEAAEQCGRSVVPCVESPQSFEDALANAPGILLLPFEDAGENGRNVQAALDSDIDALFALGEVSVFIGPEGGFEAGEVERAHAAGAIVVTIGSRVLRSETAGLIAAALVMHALGELG